MAHATRSPNRRQEGCERGYYHLHRQLDDLLFLHTIFRFFFGGTVVPPSFFRWYGGAPSFFRWYGGAGVSLSRGWRREITQEADCLRLE